MEAHTRLGFIVALVMAIAIAAIASADTKSRKLSLKEMLEINSLAANGGFEMGKGMRAERWQGAATHPPVRTKAEAHSGKYSMHSKLVNEGKVPQEGLLEQSFEIPEVPEENAEPLMFSFWIKVVHSGPSYVQQYHITWMDKNGRNLGSTGFKHYGGKPGEWTQVTAKLSPPAKTVQSHVRFRFVTGAVKGGSGEAYIDDIVLMTRDPKGLKRLTDQLQRNR